MVDRSIGLVGLALTLFAGSYTWYAPSLPGWVGFAGIPLGTGLLGLSAGLLMAHRRESRGAKPMRASLRLHFFGDNRLPELVSDSNVFRWYYLSTTFHAVGPKKVPIVGRAATLFVSFQTDALISTLRVRSPDATIPKYEVKEFNQRFAIVSFNDDLPSCTLELDVL